MSTYLDRLLSELLLITQEIERVTSNTKRPAPTPELRLCPVCSSEFNRKQTHDGDKARRPRVYCSRECLKAAIKARRTHARDHGELAALHLLEQRGQLTMPDMPALPPIPLLDVRQVGEGS